jgi:hypothetical protein
MPSDRIQTNDSINHRAVELMGFAKSSTHPTFSTRASQDRNFGITGPVGQTTVLFSLIPIAETGSHFALFGVRKFPRGRKNFPVTFQSP